jgi:hypothetical protein
MSVVLTRRGQLWRVVQASPSQLGSSYALIMPDLAFEVVPVSDLDQRQAYALEATHVLWAPRWLTLLREDEVRYGSYVNTAGQAQVYRYVVNGKRDFRTGFRQVSYYVTERE